MLRLHLLAAGHGDCIWISYGAEHSSHHLVIDGGPEQAGVLRRHVEARLEGSADRRLHIDLLVVTHIDDDHIGGVIDLLDHVPEGLTIGEIWFNGRPQIFPDGDLLGVPQAERLSKALPKHALAWNESFSSGLVVVPDGAPLPRFQRSGGLALTLLAPWPKDLERLAKEWSAKLAKEDQAEVELGSDMLGDEWPPNISELAASPFCADPKAANGSSIALLLDYEGRRVLLAADAHAPRLLAALDRIDGGEEPLRLDAFKLSHHGSAKNTSVPLLERVCCGCYLISTDGSHFGHPDPAAIARVLTYGGPDPELLFNSTKTHVARWTEEDLRLKHGYRTRQPADECEGMTLFL